MKDGAILIEAKYPGRCFYCDELVPAGERVLWNPDRGCIAHLACAHEAVIVGTVPEPPGRLPLWRHQQEAYELAFSRSGSLLAMDMGTGKSAVAIALLEAWATIKVLVLCPRSVVPVWPEQFEKHAAGPWTVLVPEGTIAERAELLSGLDEQTIPIVVVLNYDVIGSGLQKIPEDETQGARTRRTGMRRLCDALLAVSWDAVILDESHRIKAPGGGQSRFVQRLVKDVPRALALTGTPMPQGPADVYAQFRAIDPSIFGTSNKLFKARYCIMGGYENHQIVGYQNMDEFHALLGAATYRCAIDDVLTLPESVDATIDCVLCDEAARAYSELEQNMVTQIEEGIVTAANVLVKLLRLQQLTGGWLRTDLELSEGKLVAVDESKKQALQDYLQDLGPKNTVIFCRFQADLQTVHTVCEKVGRPSVELSGRRHDIEAQWDPGSESEVAAVQTQAGSLGISLVAAHHAVFYSLGYSLSDYVQCRARLRRPGQEHPVIYTHLLARVGRRQSVDHLVMKAIARKANVVQSVFEALAGRNFS